MRLGNYEKRRSGGSVAAVLAADDDAPAPETGGHTARLAHAPVAAAGDLEAIGVPSYPILHVSIIFFFAFPTARLVPAVPLNSPEL